MLIFTKELAKRTMNSGKSECWKSFAGNIIKIKFLISAIVNTCNIDCLLLLIGVVASFVIAGPTQTDLCQDISWLFLLFQSIYSGQGLKVHVWPFFIISNNNKKKTINEKGNKTCNLYIYFINSRRQRELGLFCKKL